MGVHLVRDPAVRTVITDTGEKLAGAVDQAEAAKNVGARDCDAVPIYAEAIGGPKENDPQWDGGSGCML